MNPEVKKKVLKALDSGQYKKCKEQLFAKDTGNVKHVCILGLVEQVYNKEHGVVSRKPGNYASCPASEVLDWAGINRFEAEELMDANDNTGKSLREIATMRIR